MRRAYRDVFSLLLLVFAACGPGDRREAAGDDDVGNDAAVVELDACALQGKPPTTISGTVYAPNGSLPLYGVNVYVPASDPGPLAAGLQCNKCMDALPGGS